MATAANDQSVANGNGNCSSESGEGMKFSTKSGVHQGNMSVDIANAIIAPCAVVMIGLPARGKTYMARKLARYLNWIGLETKVFNVGEYRRKQMSSRKYSCTSADFFRPDNEEARLIRDRCGREALADMVAWLIGGGDVGVYDATNAKRSRRNWITQVLCQENNFKVMFIESVCTDPKIITDNIREVKISSPDYSGIGIEEAIADFTNRIASMMPEYESLDEKIDHEHSFIKIYNQGEKFLVNRVQGHVHSRIVYYLMNIRVLPRTIYISRHGETDMNELGTIGGDGTLSARGLQYAAALGKYMNEEFKGKEGLKVWTSLLKRTMQTAAYINAPKEHWKALNEIDAGVCEGLTYKEIEEKFPIEFKQRDLNKYQYRYPGGESYEDLVMRLEPVIMELEQQENVLVICHQAVARCLLAYFLNINQDELPYVQVPLHTAIKLTPVAYGCRSDYINFDIDAVDTHRPRPPTAVPLTMAERKSRRLQNMDFASMESSASSISSMDATSAPVAVEGGAAGGITPQPLAKP